MQLRSWWVIAATCLSLASCERSSGAGPTRVLIDASAGPVNVFAPSQAFGAAIDGVPEGEVARLFTPHNIRAIRSAGLGAISYSLRTDLAIDAWHWTEEGAWSDPVHRRGYWISSDRPRRPVLTGWGYVLPRRGDSIDQANDDGYSRLDDGDPRTFWKSNPYLDSRYTHAPARPQWVIVAFAGATPVSAARIQWATPFARRYDVQYWTGADPYDNKGRWVDFPGGAVSAGAGGDALVRLAPAPIRARYVRLLLEESSNTAPAGSKDPRDAIGYAIAEIGLGVIDAGGRFVDAVRHVADGSEQTAITVSSTDPWHRASDRDPDAEQPGFDRIFASGLAGGQPVIVPVGALYDTPENAAAEVRFLKRRGYPVRQVEIGEEPDGQNISPEDFAALYSQFAAAVHGADRDVSVGGPSLQDPVSDTWLDADPDHSWTRRFIAALGARGRAADLQFFSFEHYPFDALCGRLDRKLLTADGLLAAGMARLHADGVPADIPWVISEYGISAFSGQGEVEMPGALFNADLIARFLSLGGRATYLLGAGPDELFEPEQPCAGYGELMLFGQDESGQATWPTAAYWAMTLLTREWVQPGDLGHQLYRASVERPDAGASAFVVAYPLKRPDGRWAVLLINRDPAHTHQVRIDLVQRAGRPAAPLAGPFEVVQYGAEEYLWRADDDAGRPARDDPPRRFDVPGGAVGLPPYSLTIVRTTPRSQAPSRTAVTAAVSHPAASSRSRA
jgi:hypothetical protein